MLGRGFWCSTKGELRICVCVCVFIYLIFIYFQEDLSEKESWNGLGWATRDFDLP